jgi:hypothetical protein
MSTPTTQPIVDEIFQMARGLGITHKPTRVAPPGTPPGRHALSIEQIRQMVEPKPVRPHVLDSDLRWAAMHEAGHGALAYAIGWTVEKIQIGPGRQGKTTSRPPEELFGAERSRQEGALSAAGVASTGPQYSPGTEDDRAAIRELGGVTFERALEGAQRALADPWVKRIRDGLVDALIERRRLEGAELQRILDKLGDV